MKEFFKRIKIVSLLDATLAVVFGFLMIFCTDFTKETIVALFASLILVVGVVRVVNYFLYGIEPFGFIFGLADVVAFADAVHLDQRLGGGCQCVCEPHRRHREGRHWKC